MYVYPHNWCNFSKSKIVKLFSEGKLQNDKVWEWVKKLTMMQLFSLLLQSSYDESYIISNYDKNRIVRNKF